MTIEEQVAQLTGRVYQLEREVAKLKGEPIAATKNITPKPLQNVAVQNTVTEQSMPDGEPEINQTIPSMSVEAHREQTTFTHVQNTDSIFKPMQNIKHSEDRSGVEKTVGIKVMAVVASLLVFASLILFGRLVYERIPEAGKIAIMAGISLVFSVVGLINMKRDSKLKTLFSAFAGCGVGGLYITILASSYILEDMSLTLVMILLSIWTLCVIVLSKFMSRMFIYICYAGIAIATVYGGFFNKDNYIPIIYYFVAVVLLFALNYTGKMAKDFLFFLQLPVAAVMFTLFYEDVVWVYIAMAILVCAVLLAQGLAYKLTSKDLPFAISYALMSVLAIVCCAAGLDDIVSRDFAYVFEVLAGILVLIAVFEGLRYKKELPTLYYTVFYVTALLLVIFGYCDFVETYIGISVFMLALLIAGFVGSNKHFKYTGFAYFLIYAFRTGDIYPVPKVVVGVFVLAAALIFMGIMVWRKYSQGDKLALLACVIMYIGMLSALDYTNHTSSFILLAIIGLVINMRWFSNNPDTGITEKFSTIVSYGFNMVMMFWGSMAILFSRDNLWIMNSIENSSLLFIMIVSLLTIAMFSINTVELFKLNISGAVIGVYICVKFTYLSAVILNRLEASGYIVSMVGLAIAITFIILGFVFKEKAFRLYGLILTLLCVIKLILVDIQYNYDILRPLSYLLAGVLCFGISWLYSRIEKKENQQEL